MLAPMDAVIRALADPHRRLIIETLSAGEATAGELGARVPIAQPGVSRHLAVLRDAGIVDVRSEGRRRLYALRPESMTELEGWLEDRRRMWTQRLGALHTEVARGKRARRSET
jgi:DNA-binding transcriptional ArsR family regulator